ncbi:MAG: DUF4423 domain-containing protein [Pseudobdellovibrionaceae bacterium]
MEGTSILTANGYQDVLLLEFNKRVAKNSSYSLRAFAQKLKLPASGLSEILNGKRGLSRIKAETIASSLDMTSLERDYFVALVESAHSRSEKIRDLAAIKVHQYREIYENPLNEDQFKLIADWWHIAILEHSRTDGFKASPIWIARKLGISVTTTREAVKRLLRLKILKKSGNTLKPTGDWLLTSTRDIPSTFIRKFHKDLIQKAYDSVESQDVMTRFLNSLVFAVDTSNEKNIEEMKNLIREFVRKLNKFAASSKTRNQLYCFTTQLFRLEEAD